jgi:hypothetical protein
MGGVTVMAARSIPGTDVRVRRGRRQDLPRVSSMLGAAAAGAPERLARFFRRLLGDLGSDLYVAEDARGEIVGLVAVTYARSLMRGGRAALLDGVRTCGEPAGALLEGLLLFAEERARRRGCRRLTAWVDPDDVALRTALLARGYRPEELLVAELG